MKKKYLFFTICLGFLITTVVFMSSPKVSAQIFADKFLQFLYTEKCGECHGKEGEGTKKGPKVRNRKLIFGMERTEIIKIITNGVKTGDSRYNEGKYKEVSPGWLMEPFAEKISVEDIVNLTDLFKGWNK